MNVLWSVECLFFKQKTAYEMRISDWSSDVCSSDLHAQYRLMAKCDLVDVLRCDLYLKCQIIAFRNDEHDRLGRTNDAADRMHGELVNYEIGRASCRERVCQYV